MSQIPRLHGCRIPRHKIPYKLLLGDGLPHSAERRGYPIGSNNNNRNIIDNKWKQNKKIGLIEVNRQPNQRNKRIKIRELSQENTIRE